MKKKNRFHFMAKAAPLAAVAVMALGMVPGQVSAIPGKAETREAVLSKDAQDSGVVSTMGITDSLKCGQKLKAVVIEYEDEVEASSLSKDTYTVRANSYTDNKTLAEAVITNVYTNDRGEMREDGKSVDGRYVIIELDENDYVGTMWVNTFYYEKDGEEVSTTYGMLDEVIPLVAQVKEVKLSDGTVSDPWEEEETTEPTENLKYDELVSNTTYIDSEKDCLPEPYLNEIVFQYALPEKYTAGKEYPMVVVECGGGLRLKEDYDSEGELVFSNQGANLAYDQSVTAWMTAKEDGYMDEDVIVCSVDYRNMAASEEYFPYDDINQVVKYMEEEFSVDTDRVYYSGNSMGSLTGYYTIAQEPELWAAFMPCNGVAETKSYDVTDEAQVQEMLKVAGPILDVFADNYIAVKWNMGEKDFMAPADNAQVYYDYMAEKYRAKGLSEEEIQAILNLTIYQEEDYREYGILNPDGSLNYHLATKLTYTAYREEAMQFLMSQDKSAAVHLEVDPLKVSMTVGDKKKLTVKVLPAVEVGYVSANENVVTVQQDGTLKAVGVGSTEVYVYSGAWMEKAAVEVKAAPKKSQTIKSIDSCKKVYGDAAFKLKASTSGDGALTYTSSNTSVVTVSSTGKVTIKGTGAATITIKAAATDKYKKATRSITITVVPKKAVISSLKAGTKQMTVTVKKDTMATGYVVEYSTSKSFKKSATASVTLKKNTKITATITKLTKGKTYYVRVRSYKTVDGKKYYGSYSSVKSVKIVK